MDPSLEDRRFTGRWHGNHSIKSISGLTADQLIVEGCEGATVHHKHDCAKY
jgi:hypothetical protein